MTKEAARKEFLKSRNSLSNKDLEVASLQIFAQFKNSKWVDFTSYHIFLPIIEKKEVNTFPILEYLWNKNKIVYCSKVQKNNLLHFLLTPQTELSKSSWGILEPINQPNIEINHIDCIFIPLLAYDNKGNRIGYGKGYYDRFLKLYPSSIKIGLSLFDPINTIDNISLTDIPLDYIITPSYFSGFPMEEK